MKTLLLIAFTFLTANLFAGNFQENDSVYSVVEEMPEFKGGLSALNKHLKAKLTYPSAAQQTGIRAKVYVKFIVDESGYIQATEIVRTSYRKSPEKNIEEDKIEALLPKFEAEALKIIQGLPKWNPGKHNGRSVKVWTTIPLQFKPNA